ncbi:hypothetical protein NM208_g15659 [Fusarium decemcellulare]|uniref:Uncharacterized protein n=1 Tax=Fusarium decemcellulare TaxID=57161 RepID=A0ACC1RFS2_9HYPO|nr:hypothetical protein NM208_g15659 [Fusarium decemcellulare]
MSASPNDTKRPDSQAREAEYQALWQVCDRAFPQGATLMEKRRKIGKAMCDTNIGAMVERHLQHSHPRPLWSLLLPLLLMA